MYHLEYCVQNKKLTIITAILETRLFDHNEEDVGGNIVDFLRHETNDEERGKQLKTYIKIK